MHVNVFCDMNSYVHKCNFLNLAAKHLSKYDLKEMDTKPVGLLYRNKQ